MKKFLAILFSVVLTVGAITVLGASVSDPYEFDGDIITNPFWWLYTTEAPTEPAEAEWVKLDGGDDSVATYYYDKANMVNMSGVISIQEKNGQGIYMHVPAAINSVTVNGKTGDSVAAIEGAGTWIYLSALNEGVNDVAIEYAGGAAKVSLKKVKTPETTTPEVTEPETPEPETPEQPGGITIVTQPQDVTALEGDTIFVSVEAKGKGLTYQWMYSTDDGETWKNSNSSYAKTAKLYLGMKNEYDGRQYKCIIKDSTGATVTTKVGTIYLDTDKSIIITIQPKPMYMPYGTTTFLEVRAKGENLSYQWQYSTDGGLTWKNSSSATAKSRIYGCVMKTEYQGRQFRCIVSNDKGERVISDIAVIGVGNGVPITILSQSNSVRRIENGKSLLLIVDAQGEGLTYQWQLSTDDGMTWKNSSSATAKSATLALTGRSDYDGRQYRCVITDAKGNSISSRTVTLKLQ